ncbi:Ferric/cupric reductase transmembrane component 2 [Wickerhamomyces ciferrii]|uniref:ferric-chelate reductase (NADPH) n=1 Tax=Wickerhamomyces ciferrii (strain ATCC 14091 / BCRC 22168 / CBS 111 / JCM 3599 / NBRC 0793 / NRRL Y-1031 F-60-10) TaxID=1206466 RepID=K0KVW2_WICCF|nr:Ferric/cupric reductase transmembrane component 2 [Wickerhamomyces ciferrii]CCH46107.1 Ferric/cupric reductase transmembrane component 2 [Wickerhamomyces ciferrii]
MKFTTLLSAALLLCLTEAKLRPRPYTEEEYAVQSCKMALFKTGTFCEGTPNKKNYKCECSNEVALGSMLYCIYEEVGRTEKSDEALINQCKAAKKKYTAEKLAKIYDNATQYITSPKKIEGFNKSEPVYVPLKYKQAVYNASYDSYKMRWGNEDESLWFGAGLLGYWAVILLVATIYNFASKISVVGKFFNSKPINTIRQYISMASLFSNKKHTDAVYPLGKKYFSFISGVLPTRIETLVLFGWFVLNVVFEGVRYRYVKDNVIWKDRTAQMTRYPGDRSGILALYGFNLTYLFVGRNNFLLWLTGWKQSTFVTYHKSISRINFLTLVLHAATMHMQSWALGKFQTRILTFWYRWGIVAGVAAAILLITGSYWVRKNYYEVFLLTHIIMAAIFLAGTWIHAGDFNYQPWAYSMAAIWCFDRAVRIFRLIAFGVRTATATVVSEETLKIKIPKGKYWKAFPGAFGYVHFLKPTTFFQSHPFTIVSDDDNEIVFYTKIKGGVTSQIHRHLRMKPGQTGQIKVTVEGPYGDPKPLKRYDTALLYSGGNGIPGLYAYAKKLAEKTDKKVKLYWVIRNWHSIDWFYEELLKLKNTGVEVVLYVTKPESALGSRFDSSSGSDSESKNEDSNSSEKQISDSEKSAQLSAHQVMAQHLDFVEFRFGRPQIDELVHSDLQESVGNVGVMACAHNAMVDDIRFAVKENLNVPQGRVDYFEELQQW